MRITTTIFCACMLAGCGTGVIDAPGRASIDTTPAQAVDYAKRPWPEKAPGATYPSLPKPMPLGEKGNGSWGESDSWGVVQFTHDEHASTYQISCQTCHHTNGAGDAAKTEQVQRCVACHKESGGDVQNPTTADGDEVDVKLAFHGNRDNTTNQAGCAACHEQRKKGPPLSQCGSCHTAR
jgi:hypothetical protein